jgi:hypothetical protein
MKQGGIYGSYRGACMYRIIQRLSTIPPNDGLLSIVIVVLESRSRRLYGLLAVGHQTFDRQSAIPGSNSRSYRLELDLHEHSYWRLVLEAVPFLVPDPVLTPIGSYNWPVLRTNKHKGYDDDHYSSILSFLLHILKGTSLQVQPLFYLEVSRSPNKRNSSYQTRKIERFFSLNQSKISV